MSAREPYLLSETEAWRRAFDNAKKILAACGGDHRKAWDLLQAEIDRTGDQYTKFSPEFLALTGIEVPPEMRGE